MPTYTFRYVQKSAAASRARTETIILAGDESAAAHGETNLREGETFVAINWVAEDGSGKTLWIRPPKADRVSRSATEWDGRQV